MSRYNYIDALRGLAIFVVVYCHLIGFKLKLEFVSYINLFLTSFFIPLFFFLSGFCGRKENIENLISYMKKKFFSLLIPTFSILLLSAYLWDSDIVKTISTPGTKGGYWFTYILFQMFITYGLIKSIKIEKWISNEYIINLLYILYFCLILLIYRILSKTILGDIVSSNMLYYNLPYFTIGLFAKKYIKYFHKYINNKYISFMLFIISFINIFLDIHYMITNLSRVLLVYLLFYKNKSFIDNNRIGQIFSLLGKYSLEIYFIHYFILLTPPDFINSYLNELYTGKNYANEILLSFLEFIIISPIVIFISYSCIYIKKILNKIFIVNQIFFGR